MKTSYGTAEAIEPSPAPNFQSSWGPDEASRCMVEHRVLSAMLTMEVSRALKSSEKATLFPRCFTRKEDGDCCCHGHGGSGHFEIPLPHHRQLDTSDSKLAVRSTSCFRYWSMARTGTRPSSLRMLLSLYGGSDFTSSFSAYLHSGGGMQHSRMPVTG